MKKIVALLVISLNVLTAICQNVEYAILEEYQGREDRTPLIGVQIKAKGCNWTVTDAKGWFEFNFRSGNTKEVEALEFIKEGYVVFNKDAVDQWRIANNIDSRFHVVLCKQKDLVNKIRDYFSVFDNELQKEIERQEQKIYAMNISLREKEEMIKEIKVEYERKLNDAEKYAEKFARIDENEIIEEEYRALQLFRENKINEALKVYEEYELGKKVDDRITVIEDATEDLKKFMPMLSQQIEWMKLGGQRNEDSLIVSLNRIIKAYHIVSDTAYNHNLAVALYDLGCIYEPIVINYLSSLFDGGNINDMEARHEDPVMAEKCFKEASDLGYAPAQYHLGRLYECYINGFHNLMMAKKYYSIAAENGFSPAIERMNDFFDFGVRDKKGNMIFYHILSQNKKKGTVKVTYFDQGFATYGKSVESIPSKVIHKGVEYDVKEIGRNAFRLSEIQHLSVPEGVETISYFAFRSTHDLKEIDLPESLLCIDDNAQAWHCKLEKINLDNRNETFYIGEDGNLYNRKDNSLSLYLESFESDKSWRETPQYKWSPSDGFPVRITPTEMQNGEVFYGCAFPSIIIPAEIEIIPDRCFYFTKIKTLTIPENILEIGNRTFMCSNDLIDVLFPKTLQGLKSESFSTCDMLSDIYVFSETVPAADINSFSDGRAFRCLHVPVGCGKKYSNAQGWSVFNHVIEDITPTNPFYNALRLRSEENYLDAIISLDSIVSDDNVSSFTKSRCECLKALLYYQTGDESKALESAEKAILDHDCLSELILDTVKLDIALSNNITMSVLLTENDRKPIIGLKALVDSYKMAIDYKRYEIMETASQTEQVIRFYLKSGNDSIREDFLMASDYCLELFDLFMKSNEMQIEDGFAKGDTDCFANSAINLFAATSEANLKQSELMKRTIDKGLAIDEDLISHCFSLTMMNNNDELEKAVSFLQFESLGRGEINEGQSNSFKTLNNIAYMLYKIDRNSVEAINLVDSLFRWATQNPSNNTAEEILLDICNFTGKKLPNDYYLIEDFVSNIENGVIPDTIDHSNDDIHFMQGYYAFQGEDYVGAIKHLVQAGYGDSDIQVMSFRLLGFMSSHGLGTKADNDLAARLYLQAIQRGDVDVSSFFLGKVYLSEEDYAKAYYALLVSKLPIASLYLATMYENGYYVRFDLSKAVAINQSLLEDEDVGEDAKKALDRIAYKYNAMAYEEGFADNYSDAMHFIDCAISLDPNSGDFFDTKGEIALWKGDVEEAVRLWNKAYKLQPDIIEKSTFYKQLIERDLIP